MCGGRAGELNWEALVAGAPRCAEPSEATVEAGDPLWFFYTSGTTGRPKAGMLTHGQMAFIVTNHLADLIPAHDRARRVDRGRAAVARRRHPCALLNVARGAATVLLPSEKLDPAVFWELVERHRVSNLFTVPTIVKMLVEHPSVDEHDRSSLRYMIYAGAPMYRADQQRALRTLGPGAGAVLRAGRGDRLHHGAVAVDARAPRTTRRTPTWVRVDVRESAWRWRSSTPT